MRRSAVVAGSFYPAEETALRRMLGGFLSGQREVAAPALGFLAPHAGDLYSGAIAGLTFACVEMPQRVLLLGPNHQGVGHPAALSPPGSWQTPLGEVAIDAGLSEAILRENPRLSFDPLAHRYEHSLEVQVPFIQTRAPGARLAALCLSALALEDLIAIGEAVARVIAAWPEPVLMVASSDMSHYIPGEVARQKDQMALDRILALDPEGLWQTVRRERISMCGVAPVTVMLAAARQLGAGGASLVRYSNSGEVTGDQSQVVGYAGVVVR
jgi:AmmeMemoRadiSam system protein B